jgi:hypothetical protein
VKMLGENIPHNLHVKKINQYPADKKCGIILVINLRSIADML